MANKLQIELVRSVIGFPQWMRVVVRGMGIRKMHQKVVLPDNGSTRGMIARVPHLLKVTPVEDGK
ncbi:MAG: 50S ribosomal protein L30 [Bdellovibrionaceae bacterium]|nr:50S ribosomal protein L30 [Bdellovibrionales bacterium]MCB9253953.1 50S ribosomal protein L30 [Pseudobdellovibrionaceae bacterium]